MTSPKLCSLGQHSTAEPESIHPRPVELEYEVCVSISALSSTVSSIEIFRTPSGKVDPLQSIIEPIACRTRIIAYKAIRRFSIHCLVCSQVH
jgi:hypothetical protein